MNRYGWARTAGVRAAVACLMCAGWVNALRADDSAFVAAPPDGRLEPAGTGSLDELRGTLARAVQQAATPGLADDAALLPAGTRLDSLVLDGRQVAHLRLALPLDSQPGMITPEWIMAVEQLLAGAAATEMPLSGIDISVRIADGPYAPVESYLPGFAPPADSDVSDDTGKTAAEAIQDRAAVQPAMQESLSPGIGGPVANADGQPVGALTGVVVFVSAGHGWTDKSTGWYLQRPLMLDMNEDYGNLDQINYFVHYLYNAGAVVVPFRPVGYQNIEIVLDNDDPGVTYTGGWNDSTTTSGYYENGVTVSGVPYRWVSTSPTETATARYTPTITGSAFYPVYCWTKDDTDRVEQVYRIHHSGGTAEVAIDHARVGKGWVWLGNYFFEAGTAGYVEITNASPYSGVVIADAIRFGNGIGDVVGAGTGLISGYPRDEEASRYWAESEAGIRAVGLPSSIWDCCSTDGDDNVGTAARWSAYMNRQDVNNDRWRRAYVEFHTNAGGGKGTVALVSSSYPTTNQVAFSTIVGDKIEADMRLIDDQFEYEWGLRSNPYYGAYGAISTYNNDNEFDATLIEVAFHDHAEDAANLRNAKVRDAVSRSSLQGLITFLNSLSGSGVPLVFPPDPPQAVQAVCDVNGNVIVSWTAPPSGGASGHAATGYKVYRSPNGYGFGNAVVVGNVLSATLTDIPGAVTTYLRVAATNAGGESMPSETLAVRPSASGPTETLVVNGYDRVSRHQNVVQTIPLGPMERPIARYVNSFDYIVQHAVALAESDLAFDSCANEAVISQALQLADYSAVIWILGRESEQDKTFDASEQALVQAYLNQGGSLLATGTEIGREMVGLGAGQSFYEDLLGANYTGDDAATYAATGTGGVLNGVATFAFDRTSGAPYDAVRPDRVEPRPGAVGILTYDGGAGGGAGIQYDSGVHRTVTFGFPFEAIGSAIVRSDIMQRVMAYLRYEEMGNCGRTWLTSFEGYPNGTQVMFHEPRYSSTTSGHLAASPDLIGVSDEVLAFRGTKSCKVQWSWLDATPQRWLRLSTFDAAHIPNPTIDLRRVIRVRLRLDSGSLRLCLGLRETGTDVGVGQDGGTIGPIEWLGADTVVEAAPQGVLVSAQPGVWQTFTFIPGAHGVVGFDGDGTLDAPYHKVVLDHLAFAATDSAGPFTLYLDAIEQPCPPGPDFDGDGDVDMEDFGHFQVCLSGSSNPQNDPDCQNAKFDGDSDVDQNDLAVFRACLTGANVLADPDCAY